MTLQRDWMLLCLSQIEKENTVPSHLLVVQVEISFDECMTPQYFIPSLHLALFFPTILYGTWYVVLVYIVKIFAVHIFFGRILVE